MGFFNTQSTVLQAGWLVLEDNEKATLNINMPYWIGSFISRLQQS